MRTHIALLGCIAALVACSDSPAAPAIPTTPIASAVAGGPYDDLPEEKYNARWELWGTEFTPCWGDEGELVTFDGAIHSMYSLKRDAMGRTVLRQHSNPQGLRGIGWQSGLQYVAIGTMRSREWYLPDGSWLPQDFAFSDRWRYVAQGDAADFDRVLHLRFTLNEAGEMVIVRERDTIECR